MLKVKTCTESFSKSPLIAEEQPISLLWFKIEKEEVDYRFSSSPFRSSLLGQHILGAGSIGFFPPPSLKSGYWDSIFHLPWLIFVLIFKVWPIFPGGSCITDSFFFFFFTDLSRTLPYPFLPILTLLRNFYTTNFYSKTASVEYNGYIFIWSWAKRKMVRGIA